jgi:hypothetical protein
MDGDRRPSSALEVKPPVSLASEWGSPRSAKEWFVNIDTLIEIEEGFWRNAGDTEFYEENFANDGRLVVPMGIMGKTEVVKSMSGAVPWDSFEIDDPVLIQLDGVTAPITYEVSGRRNSSSDEYRASISSIYRRSRGVWELVLHQQTPVVEHRLPSEA